jgi:hypothetical protein
MYTVQESFLQALKIHVFGKFNLNFSMYFHSSELKRSLSLLQQYLDALPNSAAHFYLPLNKILVEILPSPFLQSGPHMYHSLAKRLSSPPTSTLQLPNHRSYRAYDLHGHNFKDTGTAERR